MRHTAGSERIRSRIPAVVVGMVLAGNVVLLACSESPSRISRPEREVVVVSVSPATVTLPFLGDSVILSAQALDGIKYAVDGVEFTWVSSDTTAVVVNATGVATSVGKGEAIVSATAAGVTGTATVLVDPGLKVLNACMTCHWERQRNGHFAWGFDDVTCDACHLPSTDGHWDTRVGHAGASGGYVLEGWHVTLPCDACHVVGTTTLEADPSSPSDCVACHRDDYDRQHGGSTKPLTCASCHRPTRWDEVDSGHGPDGFQLLGVHVDLDCTECHDPGTFVPIFSPADENDCVACHQSDYDRRHGGTTTPTTCATCHKPTTWNDVDSPHAPPSPDFELRGVHATLDCTECHDLGTFEPIFSPTNEDDCIACHQSDYDREHAVDRYPTNCLSCHQETTWSSNTFDHDADYFPIFNGEHDKKWSDCTDCHPPPANFSDFTCLTCHEHDQQSMDSEHRRVSGYAYVSIACLSCHPQGRE